MTTTPAFIPRMGGSHRHGTRLDNRCHDRAGSAGRRETAHADMRLTKRQAGGAIERTGLADRIIALAKAHAEQCGAPVRLIVLDHATMVHGGSMIAAEEVSVTTAELTRIAKVTGAAVQLLGHTSKAAVDKALDGEEPNVADVRGST